MQQLKKREKITTTTMPFSPPFLQLAMEFVNKGGEGFGYDHRETTGLVLATEELFSCYVNQAATGSPVRLELEDQGYRLALSISFSMANPDMRAFNLTWKVDLESEESLSMLGPMIAARSVSSLRLDFASDELVTLRLTRDRNYAPPSAVELPPPEISGALRLFRPSAEDMRHFASMVAASGSGFIPPFLALPGMGADMLAVGHLDAILLARGGWIVGGVLWKPLTDSCLELYGPYLFCNDMDDSLELLLNEAIATVSRSGSRGLLRRQGALERHERFFDFLGEMELKESGGGVTRNCYYYRQMKEESSGAVYCSGALAAFLKSHYRRLSLPRQVREAVYESSRLRDVSVLAVELQYGRATAIIRPLCSGKDMAANLKAHLQLLCADGIINFLVEINTGRSEDTAFAPALEDTGFVPRILIPDAGEGDIVIYGCSPEAVCHEP